MEVWSDVGARVPDAGKRRRGLRLARADSGDTLHIAPFQAGLPGPKTKHTSMYARGMAADHDDVPCTPVAWQRIATTSMYARAMAADHDDLHVRPRHGSGSTTNSMCAGPMAGPLRRVHPAACKMPRRPTSHRHREGPRSHRVGPRGHLLPQPVMPRSSWRDAFTGSRDASGLGRDALRPSGDAFRR